MTAKERRAIAKMRELLEPSPPLPQALYQANGIKVYLLRETINGRDRKRYVDEYGNTLSVMYTP